MKKLGWFLLGAISLIAIQTLAVYPRFSASSWMERARRADWRRAVDRAAGT